MKIKLPQSGDAVKIIDKRHEMNGKQGVVKNHEYDKYGLISVAFSNNKVYYFLPQELEVISV